VSAAAVHQAPGAAPRALADRVRLAEWIAFAALAAVALALWIAYPVAPTFDSAWALEWGHQILAGHLPSFAAYRAPTEHPLWVAFGTLCAALGGAGGRAMTLVCVLSLLAVVAGLYRLARVAFGALAAALACILLLSRFHFAFYAEFAFLDIPYIGLLVWAAVLEAERPRRGGVVWVLLVLAGLLRPDAWLYLACYAVWVGHDAPWERRVRLLAIVALPALVWALLDLAVTGDPTFSFTFTTGHAEELVRQKPPLQIPGAVVEGLLDLAKPPVLIGALAGVALALWRLPLRRYGAPLALAVGGLGSFVITSLAGFAVVNRYLARATSPRSCCACSPGACAPRACWSRARSRRSSRPACGPACTCTRPAPSASCSCAWTSSPTCARCCATPRSSRVGPAARSRCRTTS
jgi:hypothetical protein